MADKRQKGRRICILHVILCHLLVVSTVVGAAYACKQLASLFWPTGTEVDVLGEEVNFLKTELSNRLLSLREEFQEELSVVLQKVATEVSMGTSYEALNNLDDTTKKIVKDAIEFYDATMTGQLDFASESLGGSIVSTRNTKDYKSLSRFGIWERSAQHIIQACVMPGECWAFKGEGAVVIQLTGKVNITAVSMEHASHALLPKEVINSTPKDFSVWGLNSLDDKGHHLGNFSYDIDGSPLQYFTIKEASANPFDLIELKIHTNHGHPRYTCLYRFRVHGSMGHPAQANTLSN